MTITPVNRRQIEAFAQGDKREEAILIGLFKEQVDENLRALDEYLQQNNQKLWKERMHRFMGAAGNMGAEELCDLCDQAEKNGIDPTLLMAIKHESSRVLDFLNELDK